MGAAADRLLGRSSELKNRRKKSQSRNTQTQKNRRGTGRIPVFRLFSFATVNFLAGHHLGHRVDSVPAAPLFGMVGFLLLFGALLQRNVICHERPSLLMPRKPPIERIPMGGRCMLHFCRIEREKKERVAWERQGTPLPVIIIPKPGKRVMKELQTICEWFVKEGAR